MSLLQTVSSSAINLHSIINSSLIPGSQILSKRQTIFLLPVDPMDKNQKDPDTIHLEAPRLAQQMHKACKRHQNTVCWVDINLALNKVLKFYQTRSNASSRNTPSLWYPESCSDGNWRSLVREGFFVTSSSSKDFLQDKWMKDLGSEVVQQSNSSQSSQPNPNPDLDGTVKHVVCRETNHEQRAYSSKEIETRSSREDDKKQDRTGRPVVCPRTPQTRFSRDSTNFNVEDETKHDRTRRPVVCRDANHEQSMLHEVDIDF